MIAKLTPFNLCGTVAAPPSKSMAHRYLIGAALSGKKHSREKGDHCADRGNEGERHRRFRQGKDYPEGGIRVVP